MTSAISTMEETYGCNLINTKHDGRQVKEFVGKYHVHVLVRQGEMTFSDGKNSFTSRQGDLAIWQMSNTIQRVECSDDFEADVLLLSWQFLQQFNPEMVWASKGFVFIRINPTFHLDEEAKRLMDDDFELFRKRLLMEDSGFKREILGRVMQIFIYDLWTVCQIARPQLVCVSVWGSRYASGEGRRSRPWRGIAPPHGRSALSRRRGYASDG